jgi:hypothetical protein
MVTVARYVALKEVLIPAVDAIFRSTYEPDGEDQGLTFTSVKPRQEVYGYIPTVSEPGFAHPLLACDLAGIVEDLIGWGDTSMALKHTILATTFEGFSEVIIYPSVPFPL